MYLELTSSDYQWHYCEFSQNDLRVHLTRSVLDDLCADIYGKVVLHIRGILQMRKLEPADLFTAVLAGSLLFARALPQCARGPGHATGKLDAAAVENAEGDSILSRRARMLKERSRLFGGAGGGAHIPQVRRRILHELDGKDIRWNKPCNPEVCKML